MENNPRNIYSAWRWEQGRLDYFDFNNIKLIANALVDLEGIRLDSSSADLFRIEIEARTGLPYLPTSYSVWRNYARVFRCELLAASIDGNMVVTDVCRALAGRLEETWSVDEYFSFMISRLYFPFPAFNDYDYQTNQAFPLCAILKYLIFKHRQTGEGFVSVDEVFSIIIGNKRTGFEDVEHYGQLRKIRLVPTGDQKRQVREMMIFFSQCSFLKWRDGALYLDIDSQDYQLIDQIEKLASPILGNRINDRDAEIISLGRIQGIPIITVNVERTLPVDLSFTEGKKVRVTHLRIERSPHLRKMLFETLTKPILCDMCFKDMNRIYPWTVDLFEVHHLLPLSSSIALLEGGTSLRDLVALCPNCHKSVHVYYKNWLKGSGLEDFSSKADAQQVYFNVKQLIQE